MADRAVRQLLDVNVVRFDQAVAEGTLVVGRFVVDVEDAILRTQELSRITMAIEAPLHLKRFLLPGQGHYVDGTMTVDAADALVDENAVAEVDEVPDSVNANPLQRSAAVEGCTNRCEDRRCLQYLRMTRHAGLDR